MTLLSVLEGEGREVFPRDGKLIVRPVVGLIEGDRAILSYLKPELLVLSAFTAQQRAAIWHVYPEADLSDLEASRDAFDAWEAFTEQERAFLDPNGLTIREMANLGNLRIRCEGRVVRGEKKLWEIRCPSDYQAPCR